MTVLDFFFIDAGRDLTLDFGEISRPVRVSGNRPIDSIHWEPTQDLICVDCPEIQIKGTEDIAYVVWAKSTSGCEAWDTVRVTIDNDIVRVYIPDAFSPNGDGVNDRFGIFAFEETVQQVVLFKIFDRWGNLIFKQQDLAASAPELGWDGLSKGKAMAPGEYIYVLELELIDNSTILRTGSVTLLR